MNMLMSYDVPKGAVLNHEFRVMVRVPAGEWKEISCYLVKVDMHQVREASMAYFDFDGVVEVKIVYSKFVVYKVEIRPYAEQVAYEYNDHEINFCLEKPVNLSIEINGERFHNLHLFAGMLPEKPDMLNSSVKILHGNTAKTMIHRTEEIIYEVNKLPKGRTIYFEPGVHYLEECCMRIPSDTNVYIAGGAIIVGTFILSHVENVRIYGRGVLYLAKFERFSGLNAIRLSHSKNIQIQGIHLINPPHYSVYIGGSEDVLVEDVKTFSCEGWSDGVDIMSSRRINVNKCFLRTSDDCIAIYGRRWDYNGDTENITIQNSVLWADVAHPTIIGTHGDYENEGNIIQNIKFSNLDILEHHEPQANYLGCLTINPGDKNTVRDVAYENIRIEHIEHGKVLDVQIKRNLDYNPAPGKQIKNVTFSHIYYQGDNEVPSVIQGYDQEHMVEGVKIEHYYRNGKKVEQLSDANIEVKEFTKDICFVYSEQENI